MKRQKKKEDIVTLFNNNQFFPKRTMFVVFYFPTAFWIWQLFQALQNFAVSIFCCLVKDQLSSA